jgi:hypothetical protein
MPRTSAKFTQADVARVLRAIDQSGVKVEVVLEFDGRIRIVPHDPEAEHANANRENLDYAGDIHL